jgi:uncharacterized protein (TIGR02678 family)
MDRISIGKLNTQKKRRTNLTDQKELDDRRKTCMNALLNRPWIAKEKDPILYYWIKEDYKRIQDWFMTYAGYSIILNKKLAKLDKGPVISYPWMGFDEFRGPLDYTLFTYCLWFLENKSDGQQFLLTEMVKEIQEYMAQQEMEIDWKNYYHRLSMARALKKLKSLEAIQSVDGQESEWANGRENHDVLYECKLYSHYILRNFPKDLTNYKNLSDLIEPERVAEDFKINNENNKYWLYRRYLLEPVITNHQFPPNLLYFHGQKNNIISQIKKMFGWQGTIYREGILLFEPEVTAECELYPTLSAISDLCLLVCSKMREYLEAGLLTEKPDFDGCLPVNKSEIERILIQLKADYSDFWTQDFRKMDSEDLGEIVCSHLEEWGFGRWESGFFLLNSVAGRWSAQYGPTELEG